PLPAFTLLPDRGQQPPGLVAVDHGPRVYGLERAWTGPLDGLERVGGQSADLDRVLHEVVQHGPFAVGGVGRCGGSVLSSAGPAEQGTGSGRTTSWAGEVNDPGR